MHSNGTLPLMLTLDASTDAQYVHALKEYCRKWGWKPGYPDSVPIVLIIET